jgi:hypothetical protein
MPLNFTVSREDILRSKVLDPGWYKARVTKVTQETAKSDGESTNTWVDFVVLAGPAQKDGSSPKDVPVRRCFSEKAPGFIVPYLTACGASIKAEGGQYDIEKSIGKEMNIYVANRMWEGNLQNDVKDFRKSDSVATA